MEFNALRRYLCLITKEIFVSEAPWAQAITLMPARPSVPNSFPAIPGVTFHVLAYNSDGSQIFLRYWYRSISPCAPFQGELVVQYLYGQISVGVTYGESRVVLGAGLRYHKYADAILGERLKDPVVHADHAHHT